jgi:UDP-2,3-diacylglucosamine pyrophosphatase LpxH
MRPLVVVSDVHLGHRECGAAAADLAMLVDQHPGHEVVLNGDIFNLSCDARERDPAASAAEMVAAHPPLRAALQGHLAAGHALTLIDGNHDADVQRPSVRAALLDLLTGGAEAELQVAPWFIRRDGVHVEHGHLYDPDNGPPHPLAAPSYRSEPLGVALARRFLGPYNAWALADRYDATPMDNVKLMFRLFGARAPLAMLHYAAILGGLNVDAARRTRLFGDLAIGEEAMAGHAARTGVALTTLRALIAARPAPTHTSAWRTFTRLDFDGALAALLVPSGLLASPALGLVAGGAASGGGLAYLLASRARRANRAANHMPESLRAGAALVRQLTGATLVIFGHTHREDAADGYVNLGAFGDPPRPARTFVHVDEHGRADRRRLRPSLDAQG